MWNGKLTSQLGKRQSSFHIMAAFFCSTWESQKKLGKIWGFHGGDYEEWSSGLLRRVALVRTDVSVGPGSSFTLMKEAPGSSETSVLTRATRRKNREDTILQKKLASQIRFLFRNSNRGPTSYDTHIYTSTQDKRRFKQKAWRTWNTTVSVHHEGSKWQWSALAVLTVGIQQYRRLELEPVWEWEWAESLFLSRRETESSILKSVCSLNIQTTLKLSKVVFLLYYLSTKFVPMHK
jgi:hypothetical protein